jgi:ApaG protein
VPNAPGVASEGIELDRNFIGQHLYSMNPETQYTTADILIEVQTKFVPEQSHPEAQHYFFAYTIRVTNKGSKTTQLLSRHWVITDGWGRIEEVKGAGVVGQQPRIRPGETFEYSSFCPLPTPTGTMRGQYQMQNDSGEKFDTEIPAFYLIEPNSYH